MSRDFQGLHAAIYRKPYYEKLLVISAENLRSQFPQLSLSFTKTKSLETSLAEALKRLGVHFLNPQASIWRLWFAHFLFLRWGKELRERKLLGRCVLQQVSFRNDGMLEGLGTTQFNTLWVGAFLVRPVVKNAGDMGSTLVMGRPHKPWATTPGATTTEPVFESPSRCNY